MHLRLLLNLPKLGQLFTLVACNVIIKCSLAWSIRSYRKPLKSKFLNLTCLSPFQRECMHLLALPTTILDLLLSFLNISLRLVLLKIASFWKEILFLSGLRRDRALDCSSAVEFRSIELHWRSWSVAWLHSVLAFHSIIGYVKSPWNYLMLFWENQL